MLTINLKAMISVNERDLVLSRRLRIAPWKRWFLILSAIASVLVSIGFVYLTDKSVKNRPNYGVSPFSLSSVDLGSEITVNVDPIPVHSIPAGPNQAGLDLEALYSINIAKEMLLAGKSDKAMKLFEHALALAPKHPDVLNYYGEFIETTAKDLVAADHMYFKALTVCPSHEAANLNRGRLADTVEQLDQAILSRIDEKRARLARIAESDPALRRAKRESYFQHIYHSVGIEGNTMTLSQTRSIVETRLAIGGKSIAEHNEILGLDAALKYINITLINRIGEITVSDILEIHRRVLGYADPIEGGTYRKTQVFVGNHIPPPPGNVVTLMRQFEEWLNSWEAMSHHPVRYAALAHYRLVHIHPFTDGNGRTSRLLMNMILMQAGYPPVIIRQEDRQKYYTVIQQANEGDMRPFLRFIAECTERTLDMFLWATVEHSTEYPAIAIQPPDILVVPQNEHFRKDKHSDKSHNFKKPSSDILEPPTTDPPPQTDSPP